MSRRRLTITLRSDWRAALREAGRRAQKGLAEGNYRGDVLNFETPGAFFARLTERRWAIVDALQLDRDPIVEDELARRVRRSVQCVREDASVLIELGLIERTEAGALRCPFSYIHMDMRLGRSP